MTIWETYVSKRLCFLSVGKYHLTEGYNYNIWLPVGWWFTSLNCSLHFWEFYSSPRQVRLWYNKMIPPGPSPARVVVMFFSIGPIWSSIQSSRWCDFGDSPGSISLNTHYLTRWWLDGNESFVVLMSNLKKKHVVRQELMLSWSTRNIRILPLWVRYHYEWDTCLLLIVFAWTLVDWITFRSIPHA